MKHSVKITLILVAVFLITQLLGVALITKYIDVQETNGVREIIHPDTAIGEAAQVEDKSFSYIPIIIAVIVGTVVVLLLAKFKAGQFWKIWFLLAVWLCMAVSFGVLFNKYIALALALILALFKVFKKNPITHNVTELFIYPGIVILILPILNVFSAFILLLVISAYDMYAVWKSKHMITLAKFQKNEGLFAGLNIPYSWKKSTVPKPPKAKAKKGRSAILGGGDIAFPLLFTGAVLESLIITKHLLKTSALLYSLIMVVTTTIALLFLFLFSKKDKYYPAMPFITAGCLAGYGIILLL
jgi:presenilin-like A22 family membrane protease